MQAGIRSEHDDRRDLWRAFLEVVLRVQPRAVLLENVPHMATAADTTIVRTLVSELEADGYAVHTALLRACDHNVPQFRQRFFLVALAEGTRFDWPSPSTAEVTVGDAIGDLPSVEGGWRSPDGADGYLEYDQRPEPGEFVRRARKGLRAADRCRIYDHITRPVRDDDREIFRVDGTPRRCYSDIDKSLKRYRDDIFDDKYKRPRLGKSTAAASPPTSPETVTGTSTRTKPGPSPSARRPDCRHSRTVSGSQDLPRLPSAKSATPFRRDWLNASPDQSDERSTTPNRPTPPQPPSARSSPHGSKTHSVSACRGSMPQQWWTALQAHLLLDRAPESSVFMAWADA